MHTYLEEFDWMKYLIVFQSITEIFKEISKKIFLKE